MPGWWGSRGRQTQDSGVRAENRLPDASLPVITENGKRIMQGIHRAQKLRLFKIYDTLNTIKS